jgi:hypothetical protein
MYLWRFPLRKIWTMNGSQNAAQVNVIHGCNEKCTYCVVPNTRGVEQSRAPEAIKVGHSTYDLTDQHVNDSTENRLSLEAALGSGGCLLLSVADHKALMLLRQDINAVSCCMSVASYILASRSAISMHCHCAAGDAGAGRSRLQGGDTAGAEHRRLRARPAWSGPRRLWAACVDIHRPAAPCA